MANKGVSALRIGRQQQSPAPPAAEGAVPESIVGSDVLATPLATREDRDSGWQPISTAPRDGTVVDLTAEDDDGVPWQMQWDAAFVNHLVSPLPGVWITPDGAFTWSEAEPEFGPTRWRPLRGDA